MIRKITPADQDLEAAIQRIISKHPRYPQRLLPHEAIKRDDALQRGSDLQRAWSDAGCPWGDRR